MQKDYIFVFIKDNGEVGAATKDDIDRSIRSYERSGAEIDFKTIGRIERPQTLDFPESAIEWYEKDEKSLEVVSHAILSIINELKYGQSNYAGKDY